MFQISGHIMVKQITSGKVFVCNHVTWIVDNDPHEVKTKSINISILWPPTILPWVQFINTSVAYASGLSVNLLPN